MFPSRGAGLAAGTLLRRDQLHKLRLLVGVPRGQLGQRGGVSSLRDPGVTLDGPGFASGLGAWRECDVDKPGVAYFLYNISL